MLQSNRVDTLINAVLNLPLTAGTSLRKIPVNLWHSWPPLVNASVETKSSLAFYVDNSDLYEFRQKIADLGEGIIAILAEWGEGNERHITTFMDRREKALEGKIYELEAELIEKYKDRVFDFHVRPVPRNSAGKPELPEGPYFLLTWQASSYGKR